MWSPTSKGSWVATDLSLAYRRNITNKRAPSEARKRRGNGLVVLFLKTGAKSAPIPRPDCGNTARCRRRTMCISLSENSSGKRGGNSVSRNWWALGEEMPWGTLVGSLATQKVNVNSLANFATLGGISKFFKAQTYTGRNLTWYMMNPSYRG